MPLANRGVPTRTIQEYLGHRSIASTAIYTALAERQFIGLWTTDAGARNNAELHLAIGRFSRYRSSPYPALTYLDRLRHLRSERAHRGRFRYPSLVNGLQPSSPEP